MNPAFEARMAELDAVLAQCREVAPFSTSIVRDASNRSNREWPWWGVSVEQTSVDGSESRRVTATVTLRSTQSEEPGSFDAEWRAQVWQGVGEDTFRQHHRYELDWDLPTPEVLRDLVSRLLVEAKASLPVRRKP